MLSSVLPPRVCLCVCTCACLCFCLCVIYVLCKHNSGHIATTDFVERTHEDFYVKSELMNEFLEWRGGPSSSNCSTGVY